MPYSGVPDNLTAKMESCVTKAMADGHKKGDAVAICKAQIMKKKSIIIPLGGSVYNQVLEPATRIATVSDGGLVVPTSRFRAYGVLFGSPTQRDLYGTWFDKNTRYYLGWYRTLPWLYHHGMNPMLRAEGIQKIGEWDTFGMDDVGVFLEGELDLRHKYAEALVKLANAGLLFPSSGTLEYAARISDDGYVQEWPIVEVSSTVSPGEWRAGAITPEVRSAFATLSQLEPTTGGIFTMAGFGDRVRELLGHRAVSDGGGETVVSPVEEALEAVAVEGTVGALGTLQGTLSESPADRSGDVDALIRAVQALDERVQASDQAVHDLQELVVQMAQEETSRARSAMTDPEWYNRLFAVTRAASVPPVPVAEVDAVRAANNPKPEGNGGGGIFDAVRRS
jgi:hypothetical protein